MRVLVAIMLMVSVAACGSRRVEVKTGATADSGLSVHFTNNLAKAVNVYVVSGGSDMFLRQVGANATEHLPVQGVSSGATVTLKATTVDGANTYRSDPIVLVGMKEWRVP
jgi:hypothetical protein